MSADSFRWAVLRQEAVVRYLHEHAERNDINMAIFSTWECIINDTNFPINSPASLLLPLSYLHEPSNPAVNVANQTIKMQFITTIAAIFLTLTTSAAAIPSPIPQITLRIFNDETGANAETTIPADGTPYSLPTLFADSAIDSGDGNIFGTSAKLTKFQDTTKCQLVNLNMAGWIIDLDGRAKNFVNLDADVTKPIPRWLGGFTFHCGKAY